MKNVLEYKDGATYLTSSSTNWEDRVENGNAYSYGISVFAQKSIGKVTGWVSYTLSKTKRIFPLLNNGKAFPYQFDRPHNLNFNANYSIKKNKELSGSFLLYSGAAINLQAGRYNGYLYGQKEYEANKKNSPYLDVFNNLPISQGRNQFRLPIYHRLDINYKVSKKMKKGNREWVYSVYNIYNNLNPYFVYFNNNELKKVTFFTIIPSIGYNKQF